MRSVDRWVHPGSLGSLRCTLGVAGFIRFRSVHSGVPSVVGFTLVHKEGLLAFLGSLGSLGCALGSLGSSGFVAFTRVRSGGRWVHLGAHWWLLGTSMVVGFSWVRTGCR